MMKNRTHPADGRNTGVCRGSPGTLAVLGGDKRTESLVRTLREAGFLCRTFATPLPGENCLSDALSGVRAVILPIPASRDGVSLNAPFQTVDANTPISLRGGLLPAVLRLAPGASLLCGMPPDLLSEGAEREGIPLFDYGKDKNFLLENARLTALGMLPLLENHPRAPLCPPCRAIVAGFGRVGRAAAEILAEQGVKITILCRSEKAREDAERAGYQAASFDWLCDHSARTQDAAPGGAALLVNTVPAPVFDLSALSAFRGLYIELASSPGGLREDALAARKDDPDAYLALPGIPGKMLPKEAGEAVARAVLRYLHGKEAASC